MSEPFLSEIRMFSFDRVPRNWAACDGQLLPINQNQALFSLLGTTYGGNGIQTFALPNLQGRLPIHTGPHYTLGQNAGEVTHTLIIQEMPAHTHQLVGTATAPTQGPPSNTMLLAGAPIYLSPDSNLVPLDPASLSTVGGSQPHPNMQPYLPLSFCIALTGIFPSRD